MNTKRAPAVSSLALLGLLATVSTQLGCKQDFQVTEVLGTMAADPGTVDMGLVPVGTEASGSVTLTVDQGRVTVLDIAVTNVEGEYIARISDDLPTLTKDEPYVLNFTYLPETEGYHWADVVIETDEGQEGNTWVVNVRGEAALPKVRAYPAVVDFGAVAAGDVAESTVTLLNDGRLPVDLAALMVDGAGFDADTSTPAYLDAGEQVDITVSYSPTHESAASGSLGFDLGEVATVTPVTLRANDCTTASGDLYDRDQDGFGWCGGDCDDGNADVNPGARETCDGVDQDCNGLIDDGTECYDDDGDGFSEEDGDCNDGIYEVNPDAEEIRGNGMDDDCDGEVDSAGLDADGDGFSPEAEAVVDCDDSDDSIHPGAIESCDGVDEDCDGTVDEGTTCYDDDGDGFTEDDGDCDDTDDTVYPGAAETADWVDEDCDGTVDEDTIHSDDDGDGFSEIGGDCDDEDDEASPALPEEEGDGIDNDCDGVID